MTSAHKGFTLVELLVVISIIAILSVAGIVVFTNVQKGVRDSRRKADIDAIAKAYESKAASGTYTAITNSDFASNLKPQDPDSTKGNYFNWLASDGSGFKACASLDNNPSSACNTPAQNCYCKSSSQNNINSSSSADSSSTQTLLGLGGSQVCDSGGTLLSGLMGYWNLNENSSGSAAGQTLFDISGNGYNGTGVGAAGPLWTSIAQFGNALSFTASDQSVNVAINNFNITNGSVALWIRPNWVAPLASGGYQAMISLSNAAGVSPSNSSVVIEQHQEFGGRIGMWWINKNGNNLWSGYATATWPAYSWHLLVMTWTGNNRTLGTANLYLDGQPFTSQTNIGAMDDFQYIYVGDFIYGRTNFDGIIDDVRVYNRALSPQEIQNLWNNGAGCLS